MLRPRNSFRGLSFASHLAHPRLNSTCSRFPGQTRLETPNCCQSRATAAHGDHIGLTLCTRCGGRTAAVNLREYHRWPASKKPSEDTSRRFLKNYRRTSRDDYKNTRRRCLSKSFNLLSERPGCQGRTERCVAALRERLRTQRSRRSAAAESENRSDLSGELIQRAGCHFVHSPNKLSGKPYNPSGALQPTLAPRSLQW
jgi:hypothetical protein